MKKLIFICIAYITACILTSCASFEHKNTGVAGGVVSGVAHGHANS